jgi:quercetin dioxygenase-like cupin family protein
MPFFKWEEMNKDFITPEYSSANGPNIQGEKIEVGLFSFPAGTEAKAHAHPNEQIIVVLRGRGKWVIGNEERVLGPGEAALIPVEVKHSLQVLEDLQTINCKSVVPGWSVYNVRWEK